MQARKMNTQSRFLFQRGDAVGTRYSRQMPNEVCRCPECVADVGRCGGGGGGVGVGGLLERRGRSRGHSHVPDDHSCFWLKEREGEGLGARSSHSHLHRCREHEDGPGWSPKTPSVPRLCPGTTPHLCSRLGSVNAYLGFCHLPPPGPRHESVGACECT